MSDFIYLPACTTEDSHDCYWDATVQGNGTGTSFATYQGHTLTYTVPEGSYTLDVAVNPASPTGFTTVFQEYPAAVQDTPAPAYDLTLPVVIVAVALAACGVALVVGFFRRDKVS